MQTANSAVITFYNSIPFTVRVRDIFARATQSMHFPHPALVAAPLVKGTFTLPFSHYNDISMLFMLVFELCHQEIVILTYINDRMNSSLFSKL